MMKRRKLWKPENAHLGGTSNISLRGFDSQLWGFPGGFSPTYCNLYLYVNLFRVRKINHNSDKWLCIDNNYITQINHQIIPLAQLINNKPPLIITFKADKCKFIDNNQIIKMHCQISRFEESLNKVLLSLIISFVADPC